MNNPDIIENNPEISQEEMREWRLEESNTPITTINSPFFGGLLKVNRGQENIVWDLINWGLLLTKDQNTKKCVTYHGVGEALTLQKCNSTGPNVRRLYSVIWSVTTHWYKPKQQLLTVVKKNIRQALEYTSDFTIRPFNTNFCVKANSTMLVLEPCTKTSAICGTRTN